MNSGRPAPSVLNQSYRPYTGTAATTEVSASSNPGWFGSFGVRGGQRALVATGRTARHRDELGIATVVGDVGLHPGQCA